MRIQHQHQGRPLLHDAHPRMRMTVDAPLMTLGQPEPPFQLQVVFRQSQGVAAAEQPRLPTSHLLRQVLRERLRRSGKPLPQLLKEAFPETSRLAVLRNSAAANLSALRTTEEAARTLGIVTPDFIVPNMVAEAASGSKTPKEAAERAQKRAERYYKV